tara:strand:+ start:757 stop:1005 length:249 start_codon:yes stop_codon:yes gene_type:complete
MQIDLENYQYLEGSKLREQVGGDHYSKLAIQPVTYINANGLSYLQGNVIKYVTRYKDKNGLQDLEKAKHYVEMLIELEGKNE